MEEKIKCPGNKLMNLVGIIVACEKINEEPNIKKESKIGKIVIGGHTIDEVLKNLGTNISKLKLEAYGERQKILPELLAYGSTKKEILSGLRKHVKTCQNCSNHYLSYLSLRANLLISSKYFIQDNNPIDRNLIKEGEKYSKKGLFALLKEEDKKYLGLFNKNEI